MLGKDAAWLLERLQYKEAPQESEARTKDLERLVFLTEYRPVLMKELHGLRGKKDRLRS